jgi:hypothetical protein
MAQPPPMRSPPRPSQVVREVASVATPQGHHVVVTLERISTGGTWREAAFLRAAAGAMHEPECGGKKRAKALFHETLQPSLLRCLATLWPALERLFAFPCLPSDISCAGRYTSEVATLAARLWLPARQRPHLCHGSNARDSWSAWDVWEE